MNSKLLARSILGLATTCMGLSAQAQTININFNTDANGVPIVAPQDFINATALTNTYAPLGVTFSGPGGGDGGAILNKSSDFGVNPLSGSNFLAFNSSASMSGGGVGVGPETITFSTPQKDVSIYAAGGQNGAETFLLQGFDAAGALVDVDKVTTQAFSDLSVSSLMGIESVTVSAVSTPLDGPSFVLDDLSATGFSSGVAPATGFPTSAVPEPSAAGLLLGSAAIAGLLLRGRRLIS